MNPLKRLIAKILSIDIDLKEHYKGYRKLMELLNPPLKLRYNLLDHKIFVNGTEIPVRIFAPEELSPETKCKVLIFFHGGGWVTGNIDTYTATCGNMSDATDCIIISVDYRLAPEHPFPIGLEDCYAVTREIASMPELVGGVDNEIVLVGDSAGANLAAVVSLLARDRGEFEVSKQILFYPATNSDYSENSPFPSVQENGEDYILTREKIIDYMELYVPNKEDLKNFKVAPILAEDLCCQPDTMIITAEYDPLRDEGEAYGRRLREAGNRVAVYRMNDIVHGFITLPKGTSYVSKSYYLMNAFLKGELEWDDVIDEKIKKI